MLSIGYASMKLTREQKTAIRRFLNPLGTFAPTRKLEALALIHGTDKLAHGYIAHYARHFAPIRHKRMNVLEIGVGGYDDPKAGANSLRMWQAYFPNSMIYGVDIADKSYHEAKRLKLFQGSQNDPEFLAWLVERIGRIDIVIDDGSHVNEHVRTSFCHLFPKLATPGIYVIEDLHTSYLSSFGGDEQNLRNGSTSMVLLKDLLDSLNHQYIPNRAATEFDGNIEAICAHPKIAFIFKGDNTRTFDGMIP